ncbi:hypothetical protein [Nocardiopsis sp. CNR-923]|uniref:hypothetical protein n=1 Tax=Nocardiopsis sp. CNR-923 TaxID=1904965 RepID=UPI00373FCFD9
MHVTSAVAALIVLAAAVQAWVLLRGETSQAVAARRDEAEGPVTQARERSEERARG